jgi:hypothetical protein
MFNKDNRAYKRFPVNLPVNFSYGDTLFSGVMQNLSENGMCIHTSRLLPCKTCVTMLIHLEKGFLEVSARVSRIEVTMNIYNSMGLEILNPQRNYLELVGNLSKNI